jgi:hypothetical protein
VSVSVAANAAETDATGFVVLTRGSDRRRIPYWLRIERPRLGPAVATLARTGTYTGTTARKPSRVRSYRYPDDPTGSGISNDLRGPETVYRFRLTKPVENFGVAIVTQGAITPRVVQDDDENRLMGDPALPLDINPYLTSYGRLEPIAAAILPRPGTYDVVFDSRTADRAGRFTFRFWINDTTPPRVRLLTRTVKRGGTLRLDVFDAGSGVDPSSFITSIDGRGVLVSNPPLSRTATIAVPARLAPGTHRLVVQVSDYQEEKNMEDVGPILPNTTTFRTTFTVAG